MNDTDTVSSAASAGEAASQAYAFLDSGVLYDVALILVILIVRCVLLGVTAKAVSRGTGDVKPKPCLYATLILCAVYVMANPTLQTDNLLRPLGVMALVGVLVCKKAFWLTLEQSFYCSVIFCLLSIFIGDYPRREIDKRYPDRATVNKYMGAAIDAYAAKKAATPPTHEPSQDILTALVRASTLTNAGVLTDMLGFLRAGLEAKAEVERLQKIAAQEAMIANLLAGGGTNTRTRASEMSALSEFLGPADTNAPAVPLYQGTNTGRRGYMETYAAAKAQIEEVNRVASNNAMIVNMLSGIGEQVTDRREEMDKLHQALLAEAMQGHIDLSAAGEEISEEQIESLRAAMGEAAPAGPTGTGTNTAADQASAAAIRKALESVRGAAGVYAASAKAPPDTGTSPVPGRVELDPLNKAILDEAMHGALDLATNGPAVTEKQVARIRKAVEAKEAEAAEAAKADTIAGKIAKAAGLRKLFESKPADTFDAAEEPAVVEDTTPVDPEYVAKVQAALSDIRSAAAEYTASQRVMAAARAEARIQERIRRWNRACADRVVSWDCPSAATMDCTAPRGRLVREDVFEQWRLQRVPWSGSLSLIRSSVADALNGVPPAEIAPAAARSELVVAKAAPAPAGKAVKKAAPPPPSPYELLSKEERAKWEKALQKIEVTGVVGSAADVAAIVNGNLVRRGETIFVESSGTNFSFRLTGISKKGKCQWEPLVGPGRGPATVTVTF